MSEKRLDIKAVPGEGMIKHLIKKELRAGKSKIQAELSALEKNEKHEREDDDCEKNDKASLRLKLKKKR